MLLEEMKRVSEYIRFYPRYQQTKWGFGPLSIAERLENAIKLIEEDPTRVGYASPEVKLAYLRSKGNPIDPEKVLEALDDISSVVWQMTGESYSILLREDPEKLAKVFTRLYSSLKVK